MEIARWLNYDLNLFAAFFLLVIVVVMYVRHDTTGTGTRLFLRIVLATIVMLVLEIASWHFDRQQYPGARALNYWTNWVYLWLNPLLPTLWAAYIDFRIFKSEIRLRRRIFYLHGMIVSTVLMALNFLRPVVFSIDAANVYHREIGIWALLATSYIILIVMGVIAARHRNRIRDDIVILLLGLVLIPAIGAFFQTLYYGTHVLWPLMGLVVVLAYVFLENHNASIDHLTGVFNRLRAEEYIRHYIDVSVPFILVLFDLDDFKTINDRYGHSAGDVALLRFTRTLQETFSSTALVARFGGDEFVVVVRTNSTDAVKHSIKTVRHTLSEGLPEQRIKTSAGVVRFNPQNPRTRDDLFTEVDRLMYHDKSRRKNLRRRQSDSARNPDGPGRPHDHIHVDSV